MNPERWQRIKDVAFAAMELEEDQRGEFLARECGSDRELRRAAEALVEEDQRDGSTIERGIASAAAGVQQKPPADDRNGMLGRAISHYRITEKLGEGGMGVVYKAEDTKLKRLVALKFLAANGLGGEEERARFLREAQAAAALNHPNICTIYAIDESEGQTFIAMECVEGKTVKDKIASRPQPLEEALDIAIQAAQGLKAAHQKEIVHRDIKPANLMLTEEGQVKVMDFGLAQPADATRLTKTGSTLGTIAYMPPEQIRGQKVDHRADIWSLGVVIYEMVTGQIPFKGEYNQLVAYNIQNAEPEMITALRAGVPLELEFIVGKALAKDRAERYQQVEELIVDLRGLSKKLAAGRSTVLPTQPAAAPPAPSEVVIRKWKLRLQQALLAVTAVALLALTVRYLREIPPETPTRKFALPPPVPFTAWQQGNVAISPNGRYIAISTWDTNGKLWVHDLNQEQLRPIENTDGAFRLFWSPDSDFIGFSADGEIKKVSVQGGPVIGVCQKPHSNFDGGSSWSPDGEAIVFSSGRPASLYEVAASGGIPKPIVLPKVLEESSGELTGEVMRPHFLPSEAGRRVVVLEVVNSSDSTMMVYDIETGQREFLRPGESPFYSPSGHIVYKAAGTDDLWALPFSLATLKATGEAFPISQNSQEPSVAADGTLVYVDGPRQARQLVWRDRSGARTGEIGQAQDRTNLPVLSPDEQWVAVTAERGPGRDVWVWNIARGVENRVNLASEPLSSVAWAPDGEQVAYTVRGAGGCDILLRRFDGTGMEKELAATSRCEYLTDWSRDGKYILYELFDEGRVDLWYLEFNEDGGWEHHPFLQGPLDERAGAFSPDGRYVAYLSNESGRYEVSVQPFPDGGQKQAVSSNDGRQPRWSRDGRELFYVERGGAMLLSVAVSTQPKFSTGTVTPLFKPPAGGLFIASYDISADGQKFVVVEPVGPETPRKVHVVQNWFTEFKDRQQD